MTRFVQLVTHDEGVQLRSFAGRITLDSSQIKSYELSDLGLKIFRQVDDAVLFNDAQTNAIRGERLVQQRMFCLAQPSKFHQRLTDIL